MSDFNQINAILTQMNENSSNQFEWLKSSVEKIENKQERHSEILNQQNIILDRNTRSLLYHIKRTNNVEARMSRLERQINEIDDHVKKVRFLMSVFSVQNIGVYVALPSSLIALAVYLKDIIAYLKNLF